MHPVGNTGSTTGQTLAPVAPEPVRFRVNIELSPAVSLCLDHVCDVTGSTRSQLINAALMDALPGLVERADVVSKRHQALVQSTAKRR